MLDSYVYVYSDPDTYKPFYVGKGKGNRAFAHLVLAGESAKINKIKEVRERGKEPLIEILVHGIDENTAFKVEAAAIDLIGIENLTNVKSGHQSSTYGRIEAGELNARYSGEKLPIEDIVDNVIMIRINKLYRNAMPSNELYDITRSSWVVSLERAQKAEYALAVYDGMIIEAYSILHWFQGGGSTFNSAYEYTPEEIKRLSHRYEFVGKIAPENVRMRYIDKSVAHLFPKGSQNPIKYFIK